MGLSRESRIITLLVIDTVFFMIELSTGIFAHSLALLADSFHMLNDIISLLISWQALKLASRPSNANHSYGYARAEILAAFGNAIFLLALCFSIFLEAIQRFIDVQGKSQVSNPKLMVIVGSFGLLSNIVGLFLFHEHGHGHSHSHGHSHDSGAKGNAVQDSASSETGAIENGGASRPVPTRRERSDSFGSLYGHPAVTRAAVIETAQEFGYGRSPPARDTRDSFTMAFSPTGQEGGIAGAINPISHHHARSKSSHGKRGSVSSPTERTGLTNGQTTSYAAVVKKNTDGDDHADDHDHDHDHDHDSHDGNGKKDVHAHDHSEAEVGGHSHGGGGHGHSHGNMNAQGVFLHVLGDALGNVGVIAAGLVIWFAKGYWRFYFDPAISLFITVIIFHSALPLVKSASFILLQGVPTHISLEAVRESINEVDGVSSLHELHIWQLTEKTIVASVHVLVSRDTDYMAVADNIRKILHEYGVHSSTIQPEFAAEDDENSDNDDNACLIRCPPEDCGGDTCCPPVVVGKLVDLDNAESHEGHSH